MGVLGVELYRDGAGEMRGTGINVQTKVKLPLTLTCSVKAETHSIVGKDTGVEMHTETMVTSTRLKRKAGASACHNRQRCKLLLQLYRRIEFYWALHANQLMYRCAYVRIKKTPYG